MFDNVAHRYDLLNRLLSLGIDVYWRRKAIATLRAAKPQRVLDVATGTADVALETYKQLQPKHITGIDISAGMLTLGRDKIAAAGLTQQIELVQGDGENLPFADASFDAVTVAYGVRNFEDLGKGLREMRRVLADGGRLVVIEFSQPRGFPLRPLFQFYFKNILPLIGRLTSRDARAYTYLYESVQAFPDGEAFLEQLRAAGYSEVTWKPMTAGICSAYTARK